jgi:hypothetical protein
MRITVADALRAINASAFSYVRFEGQDFLPYDLHFMADRTLIFARLNQRTIVARSSVRTEILERTGHAQIYGSMGSWFAEFSIVCNAAKTLLQPFSRTEIESFHASRHHFGFTVRDNKLLKSYAWGPHAKEILL